MNLLPIPERVLVVDDDAETLEAMTETIRTLGLTVYEAENGEVAWKTFEQETPDLVVTDVCMPNGDGLTLTSRVKVHQPSCPVIVVTGFGGEEAAIAALKAGASDFLVKPFQFNELRVAVDRACALIRARLAEEAIHPAVDQMESTMMISNVPEQVGGVINALLRTVDGCVSESARLHIRVALRELVLNAIEHGNLNISFEEKAEALCARSIRAIARGSTKASRIFKSSCATLYESRCHHGNGPVPNMR